LLGVLKRLGERLVELRERGNPLTLARGDVIKLTFQLGGEPDVEDIREVLDEKVIHNEAKLRRDELLLLQRHVISGDDRADRWYVGARPSYSLLLQHLDQGSFGGSRWWLGEVLLRKQLHE